MLIDCGLTRRWSPRVCDLIVAAHGREFIPEQVHALVRGGPATSR